MEVLLVLLGSIVVALLLPVLLPVVAVLDAVYRWRKTQDAERFACVCCGQILGREGLKQGDAAWAEHFTALQRAHPYAKLRVVRHVYAVCPRCGTHYDHDEKAHTFRPTPAPAL